MVATGAAHVFYRHGRTFALQHGADESTASMWPLIVDGLLTTATVELWKPGDGSRSHGRWAAWLAYFFGISLSLCANIGTAPEPSIFAITVAACPPLALLLAVELLNRALKRHRADNLTGTTEPTVKVVETGETDTEPAETDNESRVAALIAVSENAVEQVEPTAEQWMWQHYQRERTRGRTPTGAELDRIAGTNNYDRRVLRQWRAAGHGSPSSPELEPSS
ncbi:hypothetical protein H074_36239 [Amycolatopsis decaplanina DSM 44594]|uniref:DUF2637 domain-containing protein n=1 Tax=Amycolatopsis decaplanina DSM 44594 TaxID=1284240 RepID=M2YTS2_9PSEU|nr:hypothetical protein H074_36239 [Amycolatopsis decaplanina DSM 44594]